MSAFALNMDLKANSNLLPAGGNATALRPGLVLRCSLLPRPSGPGSTPLTMVIGLPGETGPAESLRLAPGLSSSRSPEVSLTSAHLCDQSTGDPAVPDHLRHQVT